VEGIPFEVLSQGISWDWSSFPEFMQAAQRRRSGVNLAFLAPLTPFRHFVMGEESMERAANPAELEQSKASCVRPSPRARSGFRLLTPCSMSAIGGGHWR